MRETIAVTVAVLLFIFLVWSLLRLSNYAGQVHARLHQFRSQAEAAQSADELLRVEAELRAYHKKEIWHRRLGDHAREVYAFIQGRKAAFK